MVLFNEEETGTQTIVGLHTDLTAAKQKFTDIGQVFNDKKNKSLCKAKAANKSGIGPVLITKVELVKQCWT
eukprot:16406031-Heterocapsa_arctica.AAC.1